MLQGTTHLRSNVSCQTMSSKTRKKHIDCGDKAGAYRFMLCQFLDAVESPVGTAWKQCLDDLDEYTANHFGIQF